VHDGDSYTVDCDLGPIYGHDRDLGMGLRVFKRRLIARIHVRLAHYNAAELGTPGGDAAYSAVADILTVGSDIGVRVLQPDNYGMRWDAEVTLADGRDLGELLYAEGWVAPYEGTGPKPVPPYPPVSNTP